MRKFFLAACAIALMLGAPTLGPVSSAAATNPSPGAVNPQIAALLAQFPDGGPGLRAAIAKAVEADASLAAAVVAAASVANPAQKMAMGAGLGDAEEFFAKIGSDWARYWADLIRTALLNADPMMLAAYVAATSPTGGPPGTGYGNIGNMTDSNVTTTRCISPSTPGHGC